MNDFLYNIKVLIALDLIWIKAVSITSIGGGPESLPRTNGKLERFFRTFESEFVHFERVEEFMEFYNERRTHFSLDIKNGQTPLMALHSKKVPEAIRKSNDAWMEEDAND